MLTASTASDDAIGVERCLWFNNRNECIRNNCFKNLTVIERASERANDQRTSIEHINSKQQPHLYTFIIAFAKM